MTPLSRLAVAALAALPLLPAAAGAATWEPVSYGVTNGSGVVFSVAVDPAGGVFAGGSFEDPCTGPWQLQANPQTCPYANLSPPQYWGIGRWSGTQWGAMGSGLRGSAPVGNDIQLGPDGRTYVVGPFDDAGPGTTNFLAAWNGLTWASLGTGFTPVEANGGGLGAMAFDPAGRLYVGGRFDTVSGVSALNVARWNGTSWSPVGSGPDPDDPGHVTKALAVTPDGTLYAGGNFDAQGGTLLYGIAKWDGTSWSPAAIWPFFDNGGVSVLAVDRQGTVYAGGQFSNPASGIARLAGGSWSALGSGLGPAAHVTAIATDHDGGVYVGGTRMLPVGGAPNAAQVAKWDGTTWTLLATAVTTPVTGSASVNDLVVDPAGYLYAGGAFRVIDGQLTGQIARTVIATPPGAPTGVSATAGDTTAEVSWAAPTRNGAGTITSYAVASEPDGKTCTWTSGPPQCTVTGLRRGTRYTFSVKAVNMAGEGAAATAAATTTAASVTPTPSTANPRVTRLVPAKGPTRGGTRVQVRGSDLNAVTRVTFGSTPARIIRRADGRLVVIAPAHARGRVAVTVTAGSAQGTKRGAYRYVAPRRVPAVTG